MLMHKNLIFTSHGTDAQLTGDGLERNNPALAE
jgi:hypothetical protein